MTVISTALPAGKATCCGCGFGCGGGCWPSAAGIALTQNNPTTIAVTASTLIARIVPSTKVLNRSQPHEDRVPRSRYAPQEASLARLTHALLLLHYFINRISIFEFRT
jgi:Na+-translocating ferredoxin:NAD+ oxidoreductase RNF subunit RnfB